MQHLSDRPAVAIRARRGVACVGLDPTLERRPSALIERRRPRAAERGEDAAGDAAGFVVNASRSIIYARRAEAAEHRRAAAAAAESMRNDLAFAP